MNQSKKQEVFDALIAKAPQHFTIEELCLSLNINPKTYYIWTQKRPDIREEISAKLAKRFTMRKQETEEGNIVTVEISYKEAQIARNHSIDEATRKEYVDIICYAYEKGVSIRESCRVLGIHPSTFAKWSDPNSTMCFPYAVERYKEAKNTFRMSLSEELTFRARNELSMRLRERVVKNTTYHYRTSGVDGEKERLEGYTVHEKTVYPDLQTIALVLNNLDPDFRKATAGGQMMDEKDFRSVSDEDLELMLREEEERTALLRGEVSEKINS